LKVYFGGADRPNALRNLIAAGGKRVMLSYAEHISANCWKIIKDNGLEILLDSGAFSVWKSGKRIDIDDYVRYIKKHGITQYFNLDVITDDPEQKEAAIAATNDNQKYLESLGLNPIPVFHYGEPLALLDRMISHGYNIIGLGGSVGLGVKKRSAWFSEVYARHPGIRFHGLGVTAGALLDSYQFYSVDSISWLFKFKSKQKLLADGTKENEQRARVAALLKYER